MALYNNGYPVNYPQMTIPQYNMQPPQTMNNTIVWVKQRKEAEDYLVAPNNSVVFMDESMAHLFMKSADQFGRPTFTSKLLVDDTAEPNEIVSESAEIVDVDKYLTKDDFEKWIEDTFEKRLSELRPRRQNKGGGGNA